MGEAFGDKLHPRRGATGNQPRSLAAQLSTPRQRRRRRRRQGPVTLPKNHYAQLSTVSPRSPLQARLNYARGPHLARKVERQGWELCLKKKNSKKTKQNKKFLEHPAQQMQFSRPLHTLPRAAGHSPPALRPHLGARGGHRRALTWHLLLSVQVVAVFTWVFK